jgi:hypothetical protein
LIVDRKSSKLDLKVKFKVTHSNGLLTRCKSKQFIAETEGKSANFTHKVVRELGLSPKYQYVILIHHAHKGWLKLTKLTQLTTSCTLRIHKVEPRLSEAKSAPAKQQSAVKWYAPGQLQMLQNMVAAYNCFQYQQMLLACREIPFPYINC